MPQTEPQKKLVPVPAGEHEFTLTEVRANEYPTYNDPNRMGIRWRWVFRSTQINPENGEPWEFYHFTGNRYGAPNAGLTLLYDQIVPKLSDWDKEHLNTDDLIGRRYRGIIRHEKPERPDDAPKAKLAYIQPLDSKSVSPPSDSPDLSESADDPFADQ